MTYVPPTTRDIDSSRPIPHASTVPLRVPLRECRWPGVALAVVFVVVFTLTAVAAYWIAMWLDCTGECR